MPTKASSIFGGGSVPIGAIVDGNFEGNPEYLLCDGATYNSSSYPDLNKTGLGTWGSNTFVSRTLPVTQMWTSVVFGAGVFVAVGHAGTSYFGASVTTTAATSPDGITWTSRTIPSGAYHQVIYAGGQFVAMGYGAVATSPDGVTWTARTFAPGADFCTSLAYGNGMYVAGFKNSLGIVTSPDGITWTQRATYTTPVTMVVSYVPGMKVFFASPAGMGGASNNAGSHLVSADGVTWVSQNAYAYVQSLGSGGTAAYLTPYANRVYEFSGLLWMSNSSTRFASANGGESWEAGYKSASGASAGATLFLPVNSKLFAVSLSSSSTVTVCMSRDGIDFDRLTFTGSNAAWFAYDASGNIAYGNGTYVITQSGSATSNQSSACMTLLEDSTKFAVPKLNKSFTGVVRTPYIKVA